MKNVKYGKCVRCGRTYEAKPDLTNCECGGILDIVYDYDYIKTVPRHPPAGGLEPPV